MRTCLSQSISFIHVQKRRRGKTRKSPWCRAHFLFHGCEVLRMLYSHHCLQLCANTNFVCWLFCYPLPAHRRKIKAYRRMLLQVEAALKSTLNQDEWKIIPIKTLHTLWRHTHTHAKVVRDGQSLERYENFHVSNAKKNMCHFMLAQFFFF